MLVAICYQFAKDAIGWTKTWITYLESLSAATHGPKCPACLSLYNLSCLKITFFSSCFSCCTPTNWTFVRDCLKITYWPVLVLLVKYSFNCYDFLIWSLLWHDSKLHYSKWRSHKQTAKGGAHNDWRWNRNATATLTDCNDTIKMLKDNLSGNLKHNENTSNFKENWKRTLVVNTVWHLQINLQGTSAAVRE